MSAQWGHGYYKGIEASQANDGTLVGLWFHSLNDDKIVWQGRVMRDLKNGSYVVQLFDWLDGDPSVQKVVPFEQMKGWNFYQTDRAMRYAYHKYSGDSDEDIEFSEKCIEWMRGL